MPNTRLYRNIWAGTILLGVTLACNLLSGPKQLLNSKETIESIGTQVESIVTESGDLIETAQAIATQAPDLKETVQAAITDNPSVIETSEALVTEMFSGEVPEDIPVPPEDKINDLVGSSYLVSYNTTMKFSDVVDFYKTEMPANGWSEQQDGAYEIGENALLLYTKPDQVASILVTGSFQENIVSVVITITPN